MAVLKRILLFAIPVLSAALFTYYVARAGGPWAAKWGEAHGIDVAIVVNYRYVNLVSLLTWLAVLSGVITRRFDLARLSAFFGCGFVLCDIVFYFPMARLAREPLPMDQLAIFAIQVAYAIFLPALIGPWATKRVGSVRSV